MFRKSIRFFFSYLAVLYWHVINSIRNLGKVRVKLVAIAKDEGAYIPEWVFHHLYFGFDAIEIYVNNSTDNSIEMLNKLSELKKLTFENGDRFFHQTRHSPQVLSYLYALKKSRRQGYTHCLFIDLDEFWVPKNFETSIKSHIFNKKFDVMAFEWIHKVDDIKPFSDAFCLNWKGVRSKQVKVIVATKLDVQGLNAHNVIKTKGKFVLADNRKFVKSCDRFSTVADSELKRPLKDAFIMHRSNRSQIEYIAGLSRGNPVQKRSKKSIVFKDNRTGYMLIREHRCEEIKLPYEAFMQYKKARSEFMTKYDVHEELDLAREFVLNKMDLVLSDIENAPKSEKPILDKVLKGIDLPKVKEAYNKFNYEEH